MLFDYLPFPKLIEIARYDTAATAAAGGMNHGLDEVRVVNKNDGSPRESARRETKLQLEGTIETAGLGEQMPGPLGNVPRQGRTVIFRRSDLEAHGLIAPDGRPSLKPGDRFAAVYDIETGRLLETIAENPGLYASHVEPVGYGYGPGGANLIAMTFSERGRATRGPGSL